MKRKKVEPLREREIILIEDLAPIHDVKGGSRKILFGERVNPARGLLNGMNHRKGRIHNNG